MEDFVGNPYKVLGVKPSMTFEEAKRIYRRKMKELHPDLGGDPEKMMEAKKAWEYLSSSKETMFGVRGGSVVTHKSLFEIELV